MDGVSFQTVRRGSLKQKGDTHAKGAGVFLFYMDVLLEII